MVRLRPADCQLKRAQKSKRQDEEHVQRASLLNQQTWAIRGGESGVGEHEDEFQMDGVITVGFGCEQPLTAFKDQPELQRYLEDERGHEGAQSARQLWLFAFDIRIGDNVVLTRTMRGHEGKLALGRVISGYQFRDGHHHRHWRQVEWLNENASKSGFGGAELSAVNQRTTLNLICDESVAARIRSHCLAR